MNLNFCRNPTKEPCKPRLHARNNRTLNFAKIPKGSKYYYSRYLAGIWAPKVYTILLLGPFGRHDSIAAFRVQAQGFGLRAQGLGLSGWGCRV